MAEPDRQPKKTIRQLRDERGWSQQEVAFALQVATYTLSVWERGRAVPGARKQQALARLFNVSVEEIAFGPAEPAPG